MAIQFDNSATGTVTLRSPSSGTPAFTLPSADGTNGQLMQTNGSGVLSFVSNTVRVWVNFNGTGVVAINGSSGVTSITDNGVGLYTVNFSITLPDTNYAFFCTTFANRGPGWDSATATKSTTALSVQNTIPATSTNEDVTQFNVVVLR